MPEVVSTGKASIVVGTQTVEVTDPLNMSHVAADFVTEVRLIDNTLSVSFGTVIVDGNGRPTVRVCSRLRFRVELFADLQQSVAKLMKASRAEKKSAN